MWRNDSDERGFTLIELLVVILIIGLLAAIAIPVFLNQRKKGYDAAAESDIRNLASFEEIYLIDYGSYGTIAQLQAAEPRVGISHDITLTLVRYDGIKGYCVSGQHAASNNVFYYDSQAGGMQPRGSSGCPITVTGTVGDSVTG